MTTATEPKRESSVEMMPYQSIETRFLCPTNFRGSRYKAVSESGISITLSADDALSHTDNHAAACKALVDKLNWGGKWQGAASKNGYTFINTAKLA